MERAKVRERQPLRPRLLAHHDLPEPPAAPTGERRKVDRVAAVRVVLAHTLIRRIYKPRCLRLGRVVITAHLDRPVSDRLDLRRDTRSRRRSPHTHDSPAGEGTVAPSANRFLGFRLSTLYPHANEPSSLLRDI